MTIQWRFLLPCPSAGAYAGRPMADTEITTAMLLQHLQGMEQRLLTRVERLGEKIDRVETNLTRQIDGIDKRLDGIEIERYPGMPV